MTPGNSTGLLLSVVIPVYNVTLYLDQCIESVLDQGFSAHELEVLLVNDGSTDGSNLIVDKWAARYPNVKAITQPNGGLSVARNTGLDNAQGEYIVFLDSDDVVPPRAYRRMLDIVRASGSDFITSPAYRFSSGNRAAWPFNRNIDLFAVQRTGLTFEEHPEYIRDFTAWNKIYRREFFISTGVRFPEGRIYEDVATSPLLYHQARAFDVFADAGYYWRVTPGGITQTIKPVKAIDRLWSLEHILQYFESVNASPEIMEKLGFAIVDYNLRWVFLEFRRFDIETQQYIIDHAHQLLSRISDDVIGMTQKPISDWAFLAKEGRSEELTDALNNTQGVPDLSLKQVNSKRARLAARTARIKKLRKARIRHRKSETRRQLKHFFIYLVLRPFMLSRPLDEHLAVFSNYWGRKFSLSDGPASLCVELISSNPRMKCIVFAAKGEYDSIVTSVKSLVSDPSRVSVVQNHTYRYYAAIWRAKYLFNDVNFGVAFRVDRATELRPGQIEVQTTHGIPLKKMGIDSTQAIAPSELRKFLARSSRYTHLVAPSPAVAKTFADAHGVNPQILKTGLPQHDNLFSPLPLREKQQLRRRYGLDPDKKIVLYAPTFRQGQGYAFRYLLDFQRLHEALGDEYQFVSKIHPFNHTHLSMIDFRSLTDFATDRQASPFIKLHGKIRRDDRYLPVVKDSDSIFPVEKLTVHSDINELMQVADVVISDYSSLMFSYTHLDKPLILFTPDIEFYNSSRGSYYNIDEIAPGAVAKSTADVVDALRLAEDPNAWQLAYGANISAFRKHFLQWEQGNAARKILTELGLIESTS